MNNKKITIIFILIAISLLLGIVGLTMAYFTSSTDFDNEFTTGFFQTEATETFTSPQSWLPGDTTPKTLTIKNTGNVDVKARVCINESWESANGDILDNEVNGERVAILNLANTSDWSKNGNCYVYNDILEPNDETSSFIESVTFNPNIEADITCTTSGNTKTCTSSGDGYDNATYTLTFTVETVQASAANRLWNVYFVTRRNEGKITPTDELVIDTEHFYVISSNSNKTVLLAKYNLLVGDIFHFDDNTYRTILDKTFTPADEGYGLQNSIARGSYSNQDQNIGCVPFSGTNYWDNSVCEFLGTTYSCSGDSELLSEYNLNENNLIGSEAPYVYRSSMSSIPSQIIYDYDADYYINIQNNGYTIAYYVKNYINKLKELGAPNSTIGRLLSYEEASKINSNIAIYDLVNVNSCKSYIGQMWVNGDVTYTDQELTSFCNGESVEGIDLSYYLANEYIPISDYENLGVSNVYIFNFADRVNYFYSTYWLGSAFDGDDSSMLTVNALDHMFGMAGFFNGREFGVRPVIEIPTNELN